MQGININKALEQAVQGLANKIIARDPNAKISCKPCPVQVIKNAPHATVLADLEIVANGKTFLYNIVFVNGQLKELPVYRGEK